MLLLATVYACVELLFTRGRHESCDCVCACACSENPSGFNPFSSRSMYLSSPHNITTWSNIQVMRIKEIITKDEIS